MSLFSHRPELARQNSLALVMLEMQRRGPLSRAQLARNTGFSIRHICRIVDELLENGELAETSTVASGARGRPVVMLDINTEGAPIAGIHLGPESMVIAIANARGEIISRREVAYDIADGPERVIPSIAECIGASVRSVGKDPRRLKGIGASVAGLADPLLGVLDALTNRPGWEDVPVSRMLEMEMGVPVYMDNDVRAGALAAQWFGGGENDAGSLYVYVGSGIGAAYVQNNKQLLRGTHDAGCLLGHIVAEPGGPVCGCGNRGCLEAVACDMAFIRLVWPDLTKSTSDMTLAERLEMMRRGVEMAKQGNVSASAALAAVTRYLGIGIASGIGMFDPRSVSIFGTLIDIDPDLVIDLIRMEVLKHVWPRARGVEIKPLLHWQEFMLAGCIGIVQWQPYRELQEDYRRSPAERMPN